MQSIDVFVLGDDRRALATVKYASSRYGSESVRIITCKERNNIDIDSIDADLVHIVNAGTVLLPSFYEAMTCYIDLYGRDYVACPSIKISSDGIVEGIGIGQMLIKSWVLKEIGNFDNLENRIIKEYRGVEIPHLLYYHMESV